jgi:hypothetical protein
VDIPHSTIRGKSQTNRLVQIATLLAGAAHVKLDRDVMRRKSVLAKWFDENLAAVSPFLQYVRLEE